MEARLAVLEAALPRIDTSLQKISSSLESLARLEASHQSMNEGLGRAFKEIKDLEELAEKRFEKIESEMPTMKIARNVVMWFSRACMVLVVTYVLWRVGLLVANSNVARLPVPP